MYTSTLLAHFRVAHLKHMNKRMALQSAWKMTD
jgi:hypothetical protein